MSLITEGASMDAGTTTEDIKNTPEESTESSKDKLDPFGDLDEFRDAENGNKLFGRYDSVLEAMKGMQELQKEYGRLKREKPSDPLNPQDYKVELKLPEGVDGIEFDAEDPEWKGISPLLAEFGLNNEQVNKLLSKTFELRYGSLPKPDQEMEKLGAQREEILNRVNSFVHKNFKEDELTFVRAIGATAQGVQFLNKIIGLLGEKPMPVNSSAPSPQTRAEKQRAAFEYYDRHKDKIGVDEYIQEQYEKMMADALK